MLGLGDQSARKSHYPELTARLDELEAERRRYIRLNDELEQRVAARTDLSNDVREVVTRALAD